MIAEFTVTFIGEVPEGTKVGDGIRIAGLTTVQSIEADLVDITRLGSDPEFTLGGVKVGLVSNRLRVETV